MVSQTHGKVRRLYFTHFLRVITQVRNIEEKFYNLDNTTIIILKYIYIYIIHEILRNLILYLVEDIRLSEKFLSFHKVIIDEQQFLFHIILSN